MDNYEKRRSKRWSSRWRMWLLRIALGPGTFDYMLRSIKSDKRTPGAKLVDIIIRQDGHEERIEADWVKKIAQWAYYLPVPPMRDRKSLYWTIRLWWFRTFPKKTAPKRSFEYCMEQSGQPVADTNEKESRP